MENLHWEPLAPACRVLVSREHTFNTDTILLAHFAAPKHKERCIDLGTGCGTISLLWQANYAPRHITANRRFRRPCAPFRKTGMRKISRSFGGIYGRSKKSFRTQR